MFKIPSYDELEKKEKEREAKNKEIKANLFEKRKLVSLDDSTSSEQARSSFQVSSSASSGRSASTSTAAGNQQSSPEKRQRIEAASVATASSASANDDDDDDSLLMAFIDEKKEIIDQSPKIIKTTNDAAVFKVPEAPATSSVSVSSAAPRILAPNANTNINSTYGSGGALLVNSKQKGTFFCLFCF